MILNAALREQLRKTQESTMMHTCSIEPYVVADDGTISYGTAYESVCGFRFVNGDLNRQTMYEDVISTAELRLPIGVEIGMKDRVTILTAYGEDRGAKLFEVNRLPESYGPSGQVVGLQEIYL